MSWKIREERLLEVQLSNEKRFDVLRKNWQPLFEIYQTDEAEREFDEKGIAVQEEVWHSNEIEFLKLSERHSTEEHAAWDACWTIAGSFLTFSEARRESKSAASWFEDGKRSLDGDISPSKLPDYLKYLERRFCERLGRFLANSTAQASVVPEGDEVLVFERPPKVWVPPSYERAPQPTQVVFGQERLISILDELNYVNHLFPGQLNIPEETFSRAHQLRSNYGRPELEELTKYLLGIFEQAHVQLEDADDNKCVWTELRTRESMTKVPNMEWLLFRATQIEALEPDTIEKLWQALSVADVSTDAVALIRAANTPPDSYCTQHRQAVKGQEKARWFLIELWRTNRVSWAFAARFETKFLGAARTSRQVRQAITKHCKDNSLEIPKEQESQTHLDKDDFDRVF